MSEAIWVILGFLLLWAALHVQAVKVPCSHDAERRCIEFVYSPL